MKKLLIFNHGCYIYGSGRGLLNLLEVLKSKFIITVVLTKKGPLLEKITNLYPQVKVRIFPQPVSTLSFSPFYYMKFILLFIFNIIYFLLFIYKERIDILCSNSLLLPAPIIISKFAKRKHIWYLREFSTCKWVNNVLGRFVRKFSNDIICQSKSICAQLFFAEDTKVIYEPLNPDAYTKHNQAQAKKDLGISEKALIVSVISRIHPSKGQLEFLKEVKTILHETSNLVLVISGDIATSSFKDLLYRWKIYNFIKKHDITNINMLGFRKDIDRILSATDICVFPFKRIEPFGIIVAEALMFGKDSFYPKSGGLREVYQMFKKGSDIDIKDIRRAILMRRGCVNVATDFFIPKELSFDTYRKKISLLFN